MTLPGVCQYVGALTRPVTDCTQNRFLYTPTVGAALSRPQARSALGSLSEGAVSPNGLTEGVFSVGCRKPMVFAVPCRGRQLGDPLRLRRWREAKSLPYEAQKALVSTIQRTALLRELRVAELVHPIKGGYNGNRSI